MNPLFQSVDLVGGLEVIITAAATEEYEDWSLVRSPARARRRMRLGHKQNVVIGRKPAMYTYEDKLFIHPALNAELQAELSKHLEKVTEDMLYGGAAKPEPVGLTSDKLRGAQRWAESLMADFEPRKPLMTDFLKWPLA